MCDKEERLFELHFFKQPFNHTFQQVWNPKNVYTESYKNCTSYSSSAFTRA